MGRGIHQTRACHGPPRSEEDNSGGAGGSSWKKEVIKDDYGGYYYIGEDEDYYKCDSCGYKWGGYDSIDSHGATQAQEGFRAGGAPEVLNTSNPAIDDSKQVGFFDPSKGLTSLQRLPHPLISLWVFPQGSEERKAADDDKGNAFHTKNYLPIHLGYHNTKQVIQDKSFEPLESGQRAWMVDEALQGHRTYIILPPAKMVNNIRSMFDKF
jgi:hypothetical protein